MSFILCFLFTYTLHVNLDFLDKYRLENEIGKEKILDVHILLIGIQHQKMSFKQCWESIWANNVITLSAFLRKEHVIDNLLDRL